MVRILVDHTPTYMRRFVGNDEFCRRYGVLVTPSTNRAVTHINEPSIVWAMDNGGFHGVDEPAFVRLMQKYSKYASTCLWVCAPDVWANAPRTLTQFAYWREIISSHGFRVALAVQDGTELLLDAQFAGVRWDMFDALFIGGTDKYRGSDALKALIAEAKRRGKLIHLGRVNTPDGLLRAEALEVDTCDGSSFARFAKEKTAMAAHTFAYRQPPLLEVKS